jgi:tRNA G37 N-methylase Trm5
MYRLSVAMVVAIGLLMPTATARTMAQEVKEPSAKKQFRAPDVIYVPTPQEVVEKMLDLAKVTTEDVVYDLGCGDGRIVVAAAKLGAKATGWDINPIRVKEAEENVKKNNVEQNAKIIQDDIFTLDLSGASVITLYLLPSLNVKLIPQLEKLKPGSRIVSHSFDMKGVKPDQVVSFTCKDGGSRTIYLWTTPLKKETQ